MSRRILGPFSRVEGHLEIELERDETRVLEARINSPMYRGMETVMLNRPTLDALSVAPRICGICSVSQSVASVLALRGLNPKTVPLNGELVTNLTLGCETLSNHLTHFYMYFMADFARDLYAGEDWFDEAKRFKAQTGDAQIKAQEARTRLLHMMGIMAGKWPHTLTLRPGGVTQPLSSSQKTKLKSIMATFRNYLEKEVFGTSLEEVLALESLEDVRAWQKSHAGDLPFFMQISESLRLHEMGRSAGILVSGSGYQTQQGALFVQGVFRDGVRSDLHVGEISEDISHTFMGGPVLQKPSDGLSEPYLDKDEAYSWCKAPRLDGQLGEVGALSRQVVRGNALFLDMYKILGSNVETRIFARVWEMASLLCEMEKWLARLDVSAPFYEEIELPQQGQAFSFVEAARGTLSHWLRVEKGKIAHYQIVAPTTWNFSPRDHQGQPGIVEKALEGAAIRAGEDDPIAVQHIIRSFDPCMACTVH